MTTANPNPYRYGIYERILGNGMVAYSHSGGVHGFHSYLLVIPASHTTASPLFAEDENRCYARASRATYTFTRNDENTIAALDIEVDGIPIMQLQKESL